MPQVNNQPNDPQQADGATGASGNSGATDAPGTPVTPVQPGSVPRTVEQTANQAWGYVEKYGPPALSVLLVALIALVLSGWARRVVRRGLDRAKFDLTLSKFISNMVRWVILAVAGVMCLDKFGIQTTSFAALLGATGLAVGLALQGSLSHLAAGVMLLIFRPFKVGDGIAVGGQAGIVNEIDLFTTSLDTADGRRIIMPNGAVFGNVIENMTYHPRRRIDIAVTLSAANDPERVRETLLAGVRAVPGVLSDPGPDAVQADLAGNWMVTAWAKTPEVGGVKQGLLRSVRESASKAGLTPARPVMDVTITGLSESAKSALMG